jgi:hypothetical protein
MVRGSIISPSVSGVKSGIVSTNNRVSWTSYWNARFPSLLTATVISDTRIDLAWTNNGTADYAGVSIERGTDGINYAEIVTVAAGESSYSNTGLTAGTLYYYRIRFYK